MYLPIALFISGHRERTNHVATIIVPSHWLISGYGINASSSYPKVILLVGGWIAALFVSLVGRLVNWPRC